MRPIGTARTSLSLESIDVSFGANAVPIMKIAVLIEGFLGFFQQM
tara:strand:+ start:237 stop:371 length:135 start_codon:yes stop_codon:yes gene_type:complete